MKNGLSAVGATVLMSLTSGCFMGGGGGEDGTGRTNAPRLHKVVGSAHTRLGSSSLIDGSDLSRCHGGYYCITPNQVTGKIMYLAYTVGDESLGNTFTIAGAGPTSPKKVYPGWGTYRFDLKSVAQSNGLFSHCDGESYPRDHNAAIDTVEVFFNNIITTITIPSGPLEGEHTIKVRMTDRVAAHLESRVQIRRGDKSILRNGKYYYCNRDGCTQDRLRPDGHYRLESARNYSSENPLHNPNFVDMSVRLIRPLEFGYERAVAGAWRFHLDLDLRHAVIFNRDPTTMQSLEELVEAFDLRVMPWWDGMDAELTLEEVTQNEAYGL